MTEIDAITDCTFQGLPPVPPDSIPRKPSLRWGRLIGVVVVVIITGVSLSEGLGVGADLDLIARNWSNGVVRIQQLLHPDLAFFPRTIPALVETLQMAVIAAMLSGMITVPCMFWAARLSNPNSVGRSIARAILDVIRAIPDLLYASVLVAMVGVGPLPGILSLLLFDVGILVKLVSEAVDGLDPGLVEAGAAAGATRWQINQLMLLPAVEPTFINQWIFTFELNVRASSILGLVGAGGLGLLIDEVRTYYRYDQLSLIVLEILVIVVTLDIISGAIRKRLS